MSVILKGKDWKWVSECNMNGKPSEREDIELIPPTSEEIKRLKVGDRVLVGHEITDKRGYVPCCKDMIIDTDIIVAILSSSPQKAECKVPKCPSLFCVSGDIDDATRKNITDLFNTQCEIIAYLKEKEAKG
jgi:hypothetical protein